MKMTVSNIPNLIKAFIENNDQRAILFEGCWGCGKTFQIKQYINTIKSIPKSEAPDIYYVSLFGLNSTAEINTALFQEVHPKISLFEKGLSVVSTVLNPFIDIDSVFDAASSVTNIVKEKNSVIKNKIVVFDDLERIGDELHYVDILGYFNRLLDAECKIVCVGSLEEIENREFDAFVEKVFDIIYTVTLDTRIFEDLFNDFEPSALKPLIKFTHDNIRNAQKIRGIYNQVTEHIDNIPEEKRTMFDKEDILLASMFTEMILFNQAEDCSVGQNDGIIDYYMDLYGEKAAKAFYSLYKSEDTAFDFRRNSTLVEAVYRLIKNQDSGLLDEITVVERKESSELLEREYFYLSNQQKEEYKGKFVQLIDSGDFVWNKSFTTKLYRLIAYSHFVLSADQAEAISKKIIDNPEITEHDVFVSLGMLSDDLSVRGVAKQNTDLIYSYVKKHKREEYIKSIKEVSGSNDYAGVMDLLDNIANIFDDKTDIRNLLIENDFFFPCLEGELEEDQWALANNLMKIIKQYDLSKEMVEYINKDKKIHRVESPERYAALCRQYGII